MRKLTILITVMTMLVGVMSVTGAGAVPGQVEKIDKAALVDRADDCFFPHPVFGAVDLRVQKVKTSVDSGQFHCHGTIGDVSLAPAKAVRLEGVCLLPAYFGDRFGEGRAVVTPKGRVNLTCHFSQP